MEKKIAAALALIALALLLLLFGFLVAVPCYQIFFELLDWGYRESVKDRYL